MDTIKINNENILVFKICLIPYLMQAWNKTNTEIGDLLNKYNILPYVDASYEIYNTMGIQGVIEDLADFVHEQGGKV